MPTWHEPYEHLLCRRPRCQLPIAGVGEAYKLCDGHGHEERNRRLAERDANARTATQRPIVRGLTVTPIDRPLSAIVGARPTPPIQPSAATVAAKEPSMAKPLTLKPNADALPPTVCRIAGCDAKGHARGLCSPHYAVARANRSIEALALPSTQTKRPPKPVDDQRITTEAGLLAALGTLPPPARGIVERLCTEAPKLRQDLADAVARAEATKRARQEQEAAERELLEVSADVAKALGLDLDSDYLPARARDVMEQIATLDELRAERDAAVARAEAAEKAKAELEQAENDLLEESIEVAKVLGIDPSGDYDLLARARELMVELANMLAQRDAVERKLAQVLAGKLQHLGSPCLPEPKPHRVAQAGGHDLGVLVGYIDPNGLFRVTEGPKKGAVYGCLYRAEPNDRPVLGEPTPDRDVWVRTSIDEVTPHNIHTADGGRFRRSEWGPARFAPVAKSTPSSAVPGDDDLPF